MFSARFSPELLAPTWQISRDALSDFSQLDQSIPTQRQVICVPDKVAEAELDGNISKLSTTGEMTEEWLSRALDLARLVGMTDLAPVQDIYASNFKVVPTKK